MSSRVAYVNGAYVAHGRARVHIEDRGYQFADGIYEVWKVEHGRPLELEGHLDRLERSLAELRIRPPASRVALTLIVREIIRRNRLVNGFVYLQITRGVAPRDHPFPPANVRPTLVLIARAVSPGAIAARVREGVKVISVPDNRWGRCDIKTTGLLPNVLAKQAAREAGAYEAWFVDAAGYVTEGASTNAWIVDAEGRLITRDTRANILRGVTRLALIDIAAALGFEVIERAFTLEEAKAAREAFFSSASAAAVPVIAIDAAAIGDGKPGAVTQKLVQAYEARSAEPAPPQAFAIAKQRPTPL